MKFLRRKFSADNKDMDHSTSNQNLDAMKKKPYDKTATKWKKIWRTLRQQPDLQHLELALLQADIGPTMVEKLLNDVKQQIRHESEIPQVTRSILRRIIAQVDHRTAPLENHPNDTNVIVFIGINGSGKTTTIAKYARQLIQQGHHVGVAAADTYRAAAQEQSSHWAQELGLKWYGAEETKDPAAVCFNAITQAKKDQIDTLLIDTAGRLNNQKNLMQQLAKLFTVIKKLHANYPTEVYLVIDANYGFNALAQVKAFLESASHISGIILTKYDGTAKGGAIISIVDLFKIPICFLGIGEKPNDLVPFNPDEFIEAICPEN